MKFTKKIFSLLIVILLMAMCALPALAASKITMQIYGDYVEKDRIVTAQIILVHPDTAMSSGLVALSYDREKLSVVSDASGKVSDESSGPVAAKGISTSIKGSDSKRGYTWLDWYASSPISANAKGTTVATVYFKLSPSVNYSAISDYSISACIDGPFLNDLAGYGNDGGVVVCQGNKVYSYFGGDINVRTDFRNQKPPVDSTGKEVKYLEIVEVKTEVGKAPVLPKKIKIVYGDATESTAEVKWDSIDKSAYAKDGEFTVYGTVDGSAIRARCNITVGKGKATESVPAQNQGTANGGTPAKNTNKVTVSGVSVLTDDFTAASVPADDASLENYRKNLKNDEKLVAYKVSAAEGKQLALPGKKFDVTFDVGELFNGQVWSLLTDSGDGVTAQDYTVEDGKITVSVEDDGQPVVFKTKAENAEDQTDTKTEENKDKQEKPAAQPVDLKDKFTLLSIALMALLLCTGLLCSISDKIAVLFKK
ncbi:MAG: Ig-like domain-containing protein [Clostridia bacterium]|nr:Ig-like domain-containing protein [Clostridia bacterium]